MGTHYGRALVIAAPKPSYRLIVCCWEGRDRVAASLVVVKFQELTGVPSEMEQIHED